MLWKVIGATFLIVFALIALVGLIMPTRDIGRKYDPED